MGQIELSRRAGIKYALGLAAGGFLVNEIGKVARNQVKTPNGIFVPLYENHADGVLDSDVPTDLDAFYMEGIVSKGSVFQMDWRDFLYGRSAIPQSDAADLKVVRDRAISDNRLSMLSQTGASIAIGDINPLGSEDINTILKKEVVEIGLGLGSLVGLAKLRNSRREFLKRAFGGTALWALSLPITLVRPLPESISGVLGADPKLATRIADRIAGIALDFHPEQPIAFLRSVLFADKLLTLGETLKQEKGRLSKIAYEVGGDHSGVEDFLQIGRSACRQLVLDLYSTHYLQGVMDTNNGLDDFCSIRVFNLPPGLSADDVEDEGKLGQLTERRITDVDLMNDLGKFVS